MWSRTPDACLRAVEACFGGFMPAFHAHATSPMPPAAVHDALVRPPTVHGLARHAAHAASLAGKRELTFIALRHVAPCSRPAKGDPWVDHVSTHVPSSGVPPAVAPRLAHVLRWASASPSTPATTGSGTSASGTTHGSVPGDDSTPALVLLQRQDTRHVASVANVCAAIAGRGWTALASTGAAPAVTAAQRAVPYTTFEVRPTGLPHDRLVTGGRVAADATALCATYPADLQSRFSADVRCALASVAHVAPVRGMFAVVQLPNGARAVLRAAFPLTVATGIPGFWQDTPAPVLVAAADRLPSAAASDAHVVRFVRRGLVAVLRGVAAAWADTVRQTGVVKELMAPDWDARVATVAPTFVRASVVGAWDVVRGHAPAGVVPVLRGHVMAAAILVAQRASDSATASRRSDTSPWADFAVARVRVFVELLGVGHVASPPTAAVLGNDLAAADDYHTRPVFVAALRAAVSRVGMHGGAAAARDVLKATVSSAMGADVSTVPVQTALGAATTNDAMLVATVNALVVPGGCPFERAVTWAVEAGSVSPVPGRHTLLRRGTEAAMDVVSGPGMALAAVGDALSTLCAGSGVRRSTTAADATRALADAMEHAASVIDAAEPGTAWAVDLWVATGVWEEVHTLPVQTSWTALRGGLPHCARFVEASRPDEAVVLCRNASVAPVASVAPGIGLRSMWADAAAVTPDALRGTPSATELGALRQRVANVPNVVRQLGT